MECADNDEGIFRFTDVPFVGRAEEQVQIFGFDKVVHVFLANLCDSLILTVVLFAGPIQLPDLPILDHQLALDAGIVLESVGEFVRELRHDLEIVEVLILEKMALFHPVENPVDFVARPFGLGGLSDELQDLGGSEHDKRDSVVMGQADDLFQIGVDFLVAENELSAVCPLTLGADFVQKFDIARAKNTVTFGSLISLVPGDVYLDPLVFFVLLIFIEQPERNGIKANPRAVLTETRRAGQLVVFFRDGRIGFDGDQDFRFCHSL